MDTLLYLLLFVTAYITLSGVIVWIAPKLCKGKIQFLDKIETENQDSFVVDSITFHTKK